MEFEKGIPLEAVSNGARFQQRGVARGELNSCEGRPNQWESIVDRDERELAMHGKKQVLKVCGLTRGTGWKNAALTCNMLEELRLHEHTRFLLHLDGDMGGFIQVVLTSKPHLPCKLTGITAHSFSD